MEETKKKLKVYCETTFWSYLNGGSTSLSHIAVKQAFTRRWWEEIAPSCEIFVSNFVGEEAKDGDKQFAERRLDSMAGAATLDGLIQPVRALANVLMDGHAVCSRYRGNRRFPHCDSGGLRHGRPAYLELPPHGKSCDIA